MGKIYSALFVTVPDTKKKMDLRTRTTGISLSIRVHGIAIVKILVCRGPERFDWHMHLPGFNVEEAEAAREDVIHFVLRALVNVWSSAVVIVVHV